MRTWLILTLLVALAVAGLTIVVPGWDWHWIGFGIAVDRENRKEYGVAGTGRGDRGEPRSGVELVSSTLWRRKMGCVTEPASESKGVGDKFSFTVSGCDSLELTVSKSGCYASSSTL